MVPGHVCHAAKDIMDEVFPFGAGGLNASGQINKEAEDKIIFA